MNRQSKWRARLTPLRVVLIYIIVGSLWIVFSDRAAEALFRDPHVLTLVQTAKGWFYVAATAWMLYALIRNSEARRLEFYRKTILAATQGKLVITERHQIEAIAGPALAAWKIEYGEDLGTIRDEAAQVAASAGMTETRLYDFILCIGEATTNAFKHAGGGDASVHRLDDSLMFMVSDRGPGMEALILPEVALTRGYSTAGSLGMGYKAMISVADRVYLATGPTGTTVAFEMSIHPEKKPPIPTTLPDTWRS